MEIQKFRTKYNLNQSQLASLLNVNQSTVARWESGEKLMSEENKEKYINLVARYEKKNQTRTNLLKLEQEAVNLTINQLLSIALQHSNIYDKRASVKMCLLMLDERIKRGGNNE